MPGNSNELIKSNYFCAYSNYLIKILEPLQRKGAEFSRVESSVLKKSILAGVKVVNLGWYEDKSVNANSAAHTLAIATKNLMQFITPDDLENIFPIDKDYEGDRFGCKDYYFTKRKMKEIGENNLIGKKVDDLLWDYHNSEIRTFLVNIMSGVDNILRSEEKKGLLEGFFGDNGRNVVERKGKKSIPNYLTLIK